MKRSNPCGFLPRQPKETTVPKRRRLKPETTAGGAASGSAAADGVSSGSAAAPPWIATPDYLNRKRCIHAAKQHIMLAQIKSICTFATVPETGRALDEIQQILNSRSDSEEEEPSGERVIFPAEECSNCESQ